MRDRHVSKAPVYASVALSGSRVDHAHATDERPCPPPRPRRQLAEEEQRRRRRSNDSDVPGEVLERAGRAAHCLTRCIRSKDFSFSRQISSTSSLSTAWSRTIVAVHGRV